MESRTSHTLAELATAHPEAGRVFSRHGFDYACAGAATLAVAAARAGIDPELVLGEIDVVRGSHPIPRFDALPDDELIVHILVRYHDPLPGEVRRLLALVRSDAGGPAVDPSIGRRAEALLDRLAEEIDEHLAKEEQMVFPLIRGGYGHLAGTPVRILCREHDDVTAILRGLQELLRGLPAETPAPWPAICDGLRDLEAGLQEHMHLENNILFQRILCR